MCDLSTSRSALKKSAGFTLVELAIVTIIVGLLMTILLPAGSALIEQQRRKETTLKMALVDQALLAFVSANRRLPCPANGVTPSGQLGVGLAEPNVGGDCTSQATGVVPWATLGLAEADVTDGWGARLTYRVSDGSNGFTRVEALNATQCDPAGKLSFGTPTPVCASGCNHANLASCTSSQDFLVGRGFDVLDEAGFILSKAAGTGAAYVVISPMAEGGGGFSSAGTLMVPSVAIGTNGEDRNANNQGIPVAGYFHDSRIISGSGAGATHFDDLLSHPSVMQLLIRAQLAPRSQ